jgi:AcrR family transcriptional regulator
MSTKSRILEVALRQFNEIGTDQASLRSIAEEVGISHGNLCYHFKNTDVLIEALYDQLTAEIDRQLLPALQEDLGMEAVFVQLENTYRTLYKYRFLLLDFVRIIRRIGSLRKKFQQLIQLRRQQMWGALQRLIEKGLLKEEWVPGMYQHFITNMLVLGDNWIPNAEIHFEVKGEAVIRFYLEAAMGSILPFLTEKGVEEYGRVKVKG